MTFGGALTLVNGGTITNLNSTALELNFNSGATRYYIQGASGSATINGDISINIADGSFNNQNVSEAITEALIGTAYGDAKSTIINGDVKIEIDGGYFAGNIFAGGGASLNGNTYLTINGGTFNAEDGIFGGNSWGGVIDGDTCVSISNGVFNAPVFAGNHRSGSSFTQNIVEGSTYLEISGGTFNSDVCGGGTNGYRLIGSLNRTAGLVKGNSNVVIRGGTFLGNIYAAGGSVDGNASVTFIGNGENLNFTATVRPKSKESGVIGDLATTIGGSSTIYFGTESEPFIGTFNGQVENFDRMVIASGSSVTFTKQPRGIGEIIGNASVTSSKSSSDSSDIRAIVDEMNAFESKK